MTTTLPTDQAGLLAAILAAPDDDAPRLVFADWLDEHGESERAEFIRVQIELARLDSGSRCPICEWSYSKDAGCRPGNCSFRPSQESVEYRGWKQRMEAYQAKRSRERELWASKQSRPIQHPCQWFDVPGWACQADLGLTRLLWTTQDYGEVVAEVHRGFVSQVTIPGEQFAAVVDALCWPRACWRCGGSGELTLAGMIDGNRTSRVCPECSRECPNCDRGMVHGKHPMSPSYPCPTCHGHGRIVSAVTAAMQPVELVRLTSIPGGWEVRRNAGTHSNPDWADMTGELFAPNIDRHYPRRRWTLVLPDGMEIAPAK